MNDSQFSQVGILNENDARINPATEETLQEIASGIFGLVNTEYDTVELNYTNATKDNIDTIVFKKDETIVTTITVKYPSSTKEIYTNLQYV